MAEEKKASQEATDLQKKLCYKEKNIWDKYSTDEERQAITDFNQDYIHFLNAAKTEREVIHESVKMLEAKGFQNLESMEKAKAGDKVYLNLRNKGLLAAVVGKKAPEEGFNLVGSHIDSPRLDLKPNAVWEQSDMVFLKTHYYGGIKKYHYASTQLAIHGVVVKKDGTSVNIVFGEDPSEPCLTIPDLLIHLSQEQMQKKASEVITGENLKLLVGGKPYPDENINERFKLQFLQILNEKYGIVERDLLTAEIEVVPAHKARFVGFDSAFVGGYGQDDRVCAYTSLMALLDAPTDVEKTYAILFFDKEEVGSNGNTGAKSDVYALALDILAEKILGRDQTAAERRGLIMNTTLLSSDVTAAFDPNYPEVADPMNFCKASYGLGICKYSGGGGKGSTSDASAELFTKVTRLLDDHDVAWQQGELGRIDLGGGGTIAMFFANRGYEVIDCGVALLAMHSCFEISSAVDVYETYKAYKVFMEKMA